MPSSFKNVRERNHKERKKEEREAPLVCRRKAPESRTEPSLGVSATWPDHGHPGGGRRDSGSGGAQRYPPTRPTGAALATLGTAQDVTVPAEPVNCPSPTYGFHTELRAPPTEKLNSRFSLLSLTRSLTSVSTKLFVKWVSLSLSCPTTPYTPEAQPAAVSCPHLGRQSLRSGAHAVAGLSAGGGSA